MSFNAIVGTSLHTTTLILMGIGVFYDSQGLVVWAGYVSIFNGIVLLTNTIVNRPFIGTVLAPVMLLSMALLVIVGISLVFGPLNMMATAWFPNYNMIALLVYAAIMILAVIHVLTGI